VQNYYRVVDFNALGEVKKTGLPEEELKKIGEAITTIPSSFNAHNSIKKIY
jgi:2-oxoglutarate dehydrogenase complex dehydrogenase (E1) component-like enzyme